MSTLRSTWLHPAGISQSGMNGDESEGSTDAPHEATSRTRMTLEPKGLSMSGELLPGNNIQLLQLRVFYKRLSSPQI